LNREELIGRYYTEFVEEEYRKTISSFYEKQLFEKIGGTYQEFPVLTRGKQIRWMAFQTSLLYERDGQSVEGLLAIGRDITERIETEQLILIQNKNITDSINYASRIRSALQPEKQLLSELFTQFAILDEPRDIIGGDFFWLSENGPSSIFALGDCTGHGVPGAFMTTISMSILRELVKENEEQNLENLLAGFNRSLNRYLGRNGRDETMDFAELALISFDYENRDLLFISSGIALYRLRNGELSCFREASRGFGFRFDYAGLSHRIPLEPGDVFYLFTDGMYDQIGGEAGKRLSKTRLLQMIQKSDIINLEKGLNEIKNGVQEWQGKNQQTDDKMLISFRF
jgi:PAS domain S-box-containing protein